MYCVHLPINQVLQTQSLQLGQKCNALELQGLEYSLCPARSGHSLQFTASLDKCRTGNHHSEDDSHVSEEDCQSKRKQTDGIETTRKMTMTMTNDAEL